MANEQKVLNTECINGDRISSIDINGSQIPFGKSSVMFGANYTSGGKYHYIMEKNRKVASSLRSSFSRTNNKIIKKY